MVPIYSSETADYASPSLLRKMVQRTLPIQRHSKQHALVRLLPLVPFAHLVWVRPVAPISRTSDQQSKAVGTTEHTPGMTLSCCCNSVILDRAFDMSWLRAAWERRSSCSAEIRCFASARRSRRMALEKCWGDVQCAPHRFREPRLHPFCKCCGSEEGCSPPY